MAANRLVGRLRQPAYTGENRCLPCTAVNLVIAAGASVLVGILAVNPLGAVAAGAGGVAVFGVAVALIYLRGYLVPGTPTLTKRYLPLWVLRRFGKVPPAPTAGDLDPEAVLTAVDALEDCPDGPDLCLTDWFRRTWYDAIDRLDSADAGRERLLDVLGLEPREVEVREFDQAFQVYVGDQRLGIWPSEAAFLADLGAATVLADRWPEWSNVAIADRAHLLNGLRLFIDRCPSCGTVPEFGTEEVQSCCGSYDVAAVECDGCGARLFESGPIEDAVAAA